MKNVKITSHTINVNFNREYKISDNTYITLSYNAFLNECNNNTFDCEMDEPDLDSITYYNETYTNPHTIDDVVKAINMLKGVDIYKEIKNINSREMEMEIIALELINKYKPMLNL
jgi:hypothetical protein